MRVANESAIEQLERQAEDFHHLITWLEARLAGLSDRGIARLCADGRWRRAARGVLAVEGRDGGLFQQLHAELLASGRRGAFVQRFAAAAVLGRLDIAWDGCTDLANGGRAWPKRTVPARHLVVVDHMLVTDPLLTLLDLAGCLDDVPWEWVLEAALHHHGVGLRQIEEALVGPGRKDREAVARVRRVLALRPPGAPPTESVLETRCVQLCRRFGLPEPTRQLVVDQDGRFVARVDLCWPEHGTFLELDGEHHEGQPVYDARRQNAIVRVTRWLPVRLTWTQVVHHAGATASELRALLR